MEESLLINYSNQDTTENRDDALNNFMHPQLNPIFHLEKLSDNIQKEKSRALEISMTKLVENDNVAELKSNLDNAEYILHNADQYIEEFSSTLRGIYETFTELTDHLFKMVKEELNTNISDGKHE